MRRTIATVALLGGLVSGLGCHHIGGKSDCGYNPADYPIGPPTPPYPSALPTPPVKPIPPDIHGGVDASVDKASGIAIPGYVIPN